MGINLQNSWLTHSICRDLNEGNLNLLFIDFFLADVSDASISERKHLKKLRNPKIYYILAKYIGGSMNIKKIINKLRVHPIFFDKCFPGFYYVTLINIDLSYMDYTADRIESRF